MQAVGKRKGKKMDGLNSNGLNANKDIFKQRINVDDSIVEYNVETIMSLGINRFTDLSVEQEEEWGYVLCLVDDTGHKYIITLDETGCLGTVRKDSLQGEIIFLLRDD